MKMCVQYGCGLSAPQSWINFDASPRLRVEHLPLVGAIMRKTGNALFPSNVRYGDIVKGLPLTPESVDYVYCSHILEHIDRQNVLVALQNTYKILKSGGTFRLVIPDLAWRARAYIAEHDSGVKDAADRFMYNSYLGRENTSRTLISRLRNLMGNSAHLWMYDAPQMLSLLEATGFSDVRLCAFGDASNPEFNAVEDRGRFFDNGHAEVAMEARKTSL